MLNIYNFRLLWFRLVSSRSSFRFVCHVPTRLLLSIDPVLSIGGILLGNRAGLDILVHLLDGELGVEGTREASERVLDGLQGGGHKRLELTSLQTGRNDKSSDLVSVDNESTLGSGLTDSTGSMALVEVLVTLLGGKGQSLVTVFRHTVEQVEHVPGTVLLPWSQQLGHKRGSHCVEMFVLCVEWFLMSW